MVEFGKNVPFDFVSFRVLSAAQRVAGPRHHVPLKPGVIKVPAAEPEPEPGPAAVSELGEWRCEWPPSGNQPAALSRTAPSATKLTSFCGLHYFFNHLLFQLLDSLSLHVQKSPSLRFHHPAALQVIV